MTDLQRILGQNLATRVAKFVNVHYGCLKFNEEKNRLEWYTCGMHETMIGYWDVLWLDTLHPNTTDFHFEMDVRSRGREASYAFGRDVDAEIATGRLKEGVLG